MKKINDILKLALTPNEEPDVRLNQNILLQAKEANRMEKKSINKFAAVALSAALVLGIGSVSIYAAKKLMLPGEVAEDLNSGGILDAFSGEDAILINETQSYGGIDVTLYGVVSGKNLSEFKTESDDGIHDDRTYAVVSIQKSDKTPLPSSSEDSYSDYSFLVSPYIQGLNPAFYNSFTLLGGYSELEKNGVYYRISECDNIEMFADHKIYLGVSQGTFYDNNAYCFDETTGYITRNEAYEGLNALFELPLDPLKADPKAAAKFVKSLESEPNEDTETEAGDKTDTDQEVASFISKLTPETIEDYAKLVEDSVITAMPDEEGYFSYQYKIKGRSSGNGKVNVKDIFPDNKPGMCDQYSYDYSDDGLDSLVIEVYTLNEDGSVTFAIYIPK